MLKVKNRINELLSAKGWTLGKLAQRSGVDKGYLSRIARGHSVPGILQAKRIAFAFGKSIEEIFEFQNEE